MDDHLQVEVGTYRTLPLIPGTHLSHLVNVANDTIATFSLFGRRLPIPGSTATRRGRPNSLPIHSIWNAGTYNRVVRSFITLDCHNASFHLKHSGWKLLDLLHTLLSNNIWRSLALAFLLSNIHALRDDIGVMNRAIGVIRVVIALLLVILSPKRMVAIWQTQHTFWATTLTMLWTYGITPAISRGAVVGFAKHISDMQAKNAASFCASVGELTRRCGLNAYLRGTGADYTRMFKYNAKFVNRFIAPVIAHENHGAKLSEVSSLAANFAMLDADPMNQDACTRLASLKPNNAALCHALVECARATMEVNVRFQQSVTEIITKCDGQTYDILLEDGTTGTFDGVILCISPREGEFVISTENHVNLSQLLGYESDAKATEQFSEQESAYRASHNLGEDADVSPVLTTSCSHVAVVVGRLKASYFHFGDEQHVPDFTQLVNASGVSRVERVREWTLERAGVYIVTCGETFTTDGSVEEMFEHNGEGDQHADVLYYGIVSRKGFSHSALPEAAGVDDCTPPIVLGPKFVNASALECLAKHPEVDAIAAVNAASLFSRVVTWSRGDGDDDVNAVADSDDSEEEIGDDNQTTSTEGCGHGQSGDNVERS